MTVKTQSGSIYTFEKRNGKVYATRDSDHPILDPGVGTPFEGTEHESYILDCMPAPIKGQRLQFGMLLTSPVVKIIN